MTAIAFGLLGLLAVLALIWWFTRADPKLLTTIARVLAIMLGGGLAAYLIFRGWLSWLPVVLLALLPWIGRLRARWQATPNARGPTQGQSSTVAARFLNMTLAHDTGEVDGAVIEGAYAGRRLSSLTLAEALGLWRECAADDASRQLMESYLDRAHGAAWRQAQDPPKHSAGEGPMSREEARAVLGVPAGASEAEIEAAFRRVMRRAHPDQGGSDWLAAKVNRARDVLLGR